MAKLSASQAAKMVGKSVPTITRAIKSGKLAADKREGGGYNIDPAELVRVWPAVTNESNVTPQNLGSETPNVTSVLQHELDVMTERYEDMKSQRDKWEAQAQSVAHLLTDQREKPKETVRWVLWPWGRKSV